MGDSHLRLGEGGQQGPGTLVCVRPGGVAVPSCGVRSASAAGCPLTQMDSRQSGEACGAGKRHGGRMSSAQLDVLRNEPRAGSPGGPEVCPGAAGRAGRGSECHTEDKSAGRAGGGQPGSGGCRTRAGVWGRPAWEPGKQDRGAGESTGRASREVAGHRGPGCRGGRDDAPTPLWGPCPVSTRAESPAAGGGSLQIQDGEVTGRFPC